MTLNSGQISKGSSFGRKREFCTLRDEDGIGGT